MKRLLTFTRASAVEEIDLTPGPNGAPGVRKDESERIFEMLKQYKVIEVEEKKPRFFVETTWFNMCIASAILLNAVCIGLDIDYAPQITDDPDLPADLQITAIQGREVWYLIENVFTIVFLLEMLVKQWFLGWEYFKDNWNKADFALVLLSILDTWVLSLADASGGLRKFTIIRVIRMARLVRLIRLMTMFKELWLVVSGLMQSLRTIMWVFVILLLILYIVAIITTMQIGHNEIYDLYAKKSGGWDHRKYFGSVPKSMLTLFQIMTLDEWSFSITRHVITNSKIFFVVFIVFIFCTTYGLLKIVVGIIVENVLASARANKSKLARIEHERKLKTLDVLREIFKVADADESGDLELEELKDVIDDPDVVAQFRLIGIEVEEAVDLFHILDIEGEAILSQEEFMGGVLKMKGPAKSKDLLAVQVLVDGMAKRMDHLNTCILKEETLMSKLDVLTSQMSRHYSVSLPGGSNNQASVNSSMRTMIPGTYMPNYPSFL